MIDLSHLLTGIGSASIAFVGAAFTREARFNHRIDKELELLRGEVAKCAAERHEFAIIKMGVTMLVPEFQRIEPDNGVLQAVAIAFKQLPPSESSLTELLAEAAARLDQLEARNDPADR
jgi:hypothetical protein